MHALYRQQAPQCNGKSGTSVRYGLMFLPRPRRAKGHCLSSLFAAAASSSSAHSTASQASWSSTKGANFVGSFLPPTIVATSFRRRARRISRSLRRFATSSTAMCDPFATQCSNRPLLIQATRTPADVSTNRDRATQEQHRKPSCIEDACLSIVAGGPPDDCSALRGSSRTVSLGKHVVLNFGDL